MKNLVFALLMIGLGGACNRSEDGFFVPPKGNGDMGHGVKRLPPTDYTVFYTLAAPVCGGLGQVCCSTGDGLSCNDGLVCVDNAVCKPPATDDAGGVMVADMSLGTDLGGTDDMTGADLSSGPTDMGTAPDLSGPDMSEPGDSCSCDVTGRGKGLGHCKPNHHPDYQGKGLGHQKYDCDCQCD